MTGGTLSTTDRGAVGGLMLGLLIAVSLAWPLNVAAQPPGAPASDALVTIEPPQSAVELQATFSVAVTIADVAELRSYEFTVRYDPSVVQVEEVVRGPFLDGKSPVTLGPDIDNQNGKVTFGTLGLGAPPWPGGAGELATLTLRAVGQGRTTLQLRDVTLFGGDGDILAATAEDGSVQVGDDVMPTGTPTAGPDVTSTPVTPSPGITPTATPAGAATAPPDPTATPADATTQPPTDAATGTPDPTATLAEAVTQPPTEAATGTPDPAASATSTAQAGQTPQVAEGTPDDTAEPVERVDQDVESTETGVGEPEEREATSGVSSWLIAAVALLGIAGLVLIGVGAFGTGLLRPQPQPADDIADDETV